MKTYHIKVKYPSCGAELIYETDCIVAAKRMLDEQNKRTDIERAFVCNAESGIEIEWPDVVSVAPCQDRFPHDIKAPLPKQQAYYRADGPVKG